MYLILTILLLVTPVYSWKKVTIGQYEEFNLETTSLEIVTDTEAGTDEKLALVFYRATNTVKNGMAGGFQVKFGTKIGYYISFCDELDKFREFDNLPSAKVKVWRFTVTRQTDAVAMKVYCNDVLVVDTVVSGDYCADITQVFGSPWTTYWNSGPITRIYFDTSDFVSDYYQAALSCDAGNYRVIGDPYKNVASSCAKCPADTTSPAGSTSVDDCKKVCKAGQYFSGSDCKMCGENTYSGDGASACTKCPADTTSPAGSKSAEDCKKGEEDCAKTFTCSGAVTISVSAALVAAAFLATILI